MPSPKSYDDLLAERINWRMADQAAVEKIGASLAEQTEHPLMRKTAAEFVAESEEETLWRIEGLHAVGGNTTITAQYKTGKSTLMLNLMRSLATGQPFLGSIPVIQPTGTIAYWNMELTEGMFRDWMRKCGIKQDQVLIYNMRGKRQPLYSPYTQDKVIAEMQDAGVECWIIDPGAKLLPGWPGSANPENDNGCITEVTDLLDEIKERSGIKDLWIPLHTGREGVKRSRGATRWDDWADSRWILHKEVLADGTKTRIFGADGRDVELEEAALEFNGLTKSYTIQKSIEAMKATLHAKAVVLALLPHADGLSAADLRKCIKGVGNEDKAAAIDLAQTMGWVSQIRVGKALVTKANLGHDDVIALALQGDER